MAPGKLYAVDTIRAAALVTQDGVLVKSGSTTRRYLGTPCHDGARRGLLAGPMQIPLRYATSQDVFFRMLVRGTTDFAGSSDGPRPRAT
jgi:hypothetical protein